VGAGAHATARRRSVDRAVFPHQYRRDWYFYLSWPFEAAWMAHAGPHPFFDSLAHQYRRTRGAFAAGGAYGHVLTQSINSRDESTIGSKMPRSCRPIGHDACVSRARPTQELILISPIKLFASDEFVLASAFDPVISCVVQAPRGCGQRSRDCQVLRRFAGRCASVLKALADHPVFGPVL
jgi:hypothetical protein